MSNKNILNSSIKKIHPSEGHRKRLREKFLEFGLSGFLDYEIVELLLTLGTPRKDCKAIAKEAIKNFKTLKSFIPFPMICIHSKLFSLFLLLISYHPANSF